jgi:hypothetical protein
MFIGVALDFTSGMVRVHDGIGTIIWGGNSYEGVGTLGGVEQVDESVEVIARPLSLTLSGVETSLVSTAMTETYQNRTVTIYLGFLDETTNAVIDTPEVSWEGRMNQMSISSSEGGAVIKLTCEHRLRREMRIARYTNEDQQLLHSGDRFFDLVTNIKGFVSKWGELSVGGSGFGSRTQNTMPYDLGPRKEARN